MSDRIATGIADLELFEWNNASYYTSIYQNAWYSSGYDVTPTSRIESNSSTSILQYKSAVPNVGIGFNVGSYASNGLSVIIANYSSDPVQRSYADSNSNVKVSFVSNFGGMSNAIVCTVNNDGITSDTMIGNYINGSKYIIEIYKKDRKVHVSVSVDSGGYVPNAGPFMTFEANASRIASHGLMVFGGSIYRINITTRDIEIYNPAISQQAGGYNISIGPARQNLDVLYTENGSAPSYQNVYNSVGMLRLSGYESTEYRSLYSSNPYITIDKISYGGIDIGKGQGDKLMILTTSFVNVTDIAYGYEAVMFMVKASTSVLDVSLGYSGDLAVPYSAIGDVQANNPGVIGLHSLYSQPFMSLSKYAIADGKLYNTYIGRPYVYDCYGQEYHELTNIASAFNNYAPTETSNLFTTFDFFNVDGEVYALYRGGNLYHIDKATEMFTELFPISYIVQSISKIGNTLYIEEGDPDNSFNNYDSGVGSLSYFYHETMKFCGDLGVVHLVDATTGAEIGTWAGYLGGKLTAHGGKLYCVYNEDLYNVDISDGTMTRLSFNGMFGGKYIMHGLSGWHVNDAGMVSINNELYGYNGYGHIFKINIADGNMATTLANTYTSQFASEPGTSIRAAYFDGKAMVSDVVAYDIADIVAPAPVVAGIPNSPSTKYFDFYKQRYLNY